MISVVKKSVQYTKLLMRVAQSRLASLKSGKPWRYHLLAHTQPVVYSHFAKLREIEFSPQKDILLLQNQRLTELLQHASVHVPYYRGVFAQVGIIDKHGEVDLDAFSSIPILTKDIIRNRFEDLLSDDLGSREWYKNSSGGSTGVPLTVVQDKDYAAWAASNHYFFFMGGKMFGERQINLWGSERDILRGSIGLRAHIDNFLANRTLLNTFVVGDDVWTQYVERWNKIRPVGVWAYVDSAYRFAQFLKAKDLHVTPPKVMIVTAGTLYDYQRRLLKEVFNCAIVNQYGSRECGDMAASCPENDALHVFAYTHYIEILDNDLQPVHPGEQGDVYVTSLINKSMPLIRYHIGDTAVRAKENFCPCGRGWPLIEKITGRCSDHFKTVDGKEIHGEYFTHLFYFRDWVETFQVVQEAYDRIRVFVVLRAKMNRDEVTEIKEQITSVMGRECEVYFDVVDNIPASPSGKYRYTISEVI